MTLIVVGGVAAAASATFVAAASSVAHTHMHPGLMVVATYCLNLYLVLETCRDRAAAWTLAASVLPLIIAVVATVYFVTQWPAGSAPSDFGMSGISGYALVDRAYVATGLFLAAGLCEYRARCTGGVQRASLLTASLGMILIATGQAAFVGESGYLVATEIVPVWVTATGSAATSFGIVTLLIGICISAYQHVYASARQLRQRLHQRKELIVGSECPRQE